MAEIVTGTTLLFPGQGSQVVGMGPALVARKPSVADLFSRASEIVGFDLYEVCATGPKDRLDRTDVSQPALLVTSLAALDVLRSEGRVVVGDAETTAPSDGTVHQITGAAGLSLGEYTALVAAGTLTFDAAVRIVAERGRAMQAAAEASPGAMLAVLGLDRDAVAEVVAVARQPGEVLEAVNFLCPGNIVLSGHEASIAAADRAAMDRKAMRCVRLSVAGAFHTVLMQPAVSRLQQAIAAETFSPPTMPVWLNVDASVHTDPSAIQAGLARQVVSPVMWEETLRAALASGSTGFFEVGPGRVLAGLVKRIDRKTPCENIEC